jgi:hypothetical protein
MKKILIIGFVVALIALVAVVVGYSRIRNCDYTCVSKCQAQGGGYAECMDRCCTD